MTVADLSGPWEVKLRLPDHQIGHVLQAQKEFDDHLKVSFMLATDPGVIYQGCIEKVSMATEVDESEGSIVWLTVHVDGEVIGQPRPGATVISRIHCGRRSLGFVWLHDLLEFVQTQVLF